MSIKTQCCFSYPRQIKFNRNKNQRKEEEEEVEVENRAVLWIVYDIGTLMLGKRIDTHTHTRRTNNKQV